MKVLLDENLPHRLRHHLEPHDVFTASYMGWSGLKNGALLRVAEAASFAVLLTGNQTLSKEQNLSTRKIAVIALSEIKWARVRQCVPQILEAIDVGEACKLTFVDCGVFVPWGEE